MPKSASASAMPRTAESKKGPSPWAPLMKWAILTALSAAMAGEGAMDMSAIIKMEKNFKVTFFGWAFYYYTAFVCWL